MTQSGDACFDMSFMYLWLMTLVCYCAF